MPKGILREERKASLTLMARTSATLRSARRFRQVALDWADLQDGAERSRQVGANHETIPLRTIRVHRDLSLSNIAIFSGSVHLVKRFATSFYSFRSREFRK